MGSLMVLVSKELAQERWKVAVVACLFTAMGVAIPGTYHYVVDLLQATPMPPAFQELLAQQLEDFGLYLWQNWPAKNLYQLVTVAGLILGAGTVAGEVARGNAPFLFALPVRRRQVLLAKWLAMALAVSAAAVLGTATLDITARMVQGEAAAHTLYLVLIPALAGGMLVIATAMLFSVLLDDPIQAGVAAAGVLTLLSAPGWFHDWQHLSIFKQMTGYQLLTEGSLAWGPVVIMAAATAAILALAVKRMEVRDI